MPIREAWNRSMHKLAHIFTAVAVVVAVLVCGSSPASAQSAPGNLHGEVTDGSGGVLPGVTVVASSADRRLFATTVTDGVGVYRFEGLPAGAVMLTFQLEGFETTAVTIDVPPKGDSLVAAQRLGLAPITETVIVRGKAPARPKDPPPPPVVLVPIPAHDRESVCGPAKPDHDQATFGTIRSLRRQSGRALYFKRDELWIDGGTRDGISVGQNLIVRRHYRVNGTEGAVKGEHSAGLVQVVSTDEHTSVAVVVYACDELMKGDFLAAFRPEHLRVPDEAGEPAYYDAARILFADLGQLMGVSQRLMVIDRGSNYGLKPGQRLTLFRREARTDRPYVLGDAVIVATRSESATIRIERATEAISLGDWAAAQRSSTTSASVRLPQP